MKLRPYQDKAVQDLRSQYVEGKRSPMLVLPTGGGKTVIFSHITKQATLIGNTVMILLHRVELVRQTSHKLTEMGVKHGVIHPAYKANYYEKVQVASVQSLVKRFNHVLPPDLIIIDECHHVRAGQWQQVLAQYPKARTLGVTATPIRSDGKGLAESFDSIVIGSTVRELINEGFLCQPIVYSVSEADFSQLRKKMGDYDKQMQEQILDKPKIYGDVVGHYRKLADGMPTVVFCVSVNHAEKMAEAFRGAGYRSESADGSMSDDERRRVLNGLSDGSVQVLTTCDLISEGTDIPAIGCAILLRRTMSEGLYLQQVGRALRPVAGKDYAIIIDHVGNTRLHGLPDTDREWVLTADKVETRRGASEKRFKIVECERCYAVYEPAPCCPMCGHVPEPARPEPEEVSAELVQVTDMEAVRKRELRMEVGRARTMDDLRRIARERGYKAGWVWRQAQIKGIQ
jgi:DNA repair protein RadD